MINTLKKAFSLKTGTVLDVRHWPDAGMTEVDLHLPEATMEHWQDVPAIKFRVASFTYREYTPFGWDAATSTCSLLIDTGHEGPGSRWAKALKTSETVQYLSIDFTRHAPHPTDLVVGIGDSSSLAHLLALQQLTLPQTRFDGAAVIKNETQARLFKEYFRSPVRFFNNQAALWEDAALAGFCSTHSRFYIAGNNRLVSGLRKKLRTGGYAHIRIKGFWN